MVSWPPQDDETDASGLPTTVYSTHPPPLPDRPAPPPPTQSSSAAQASTSRAADAAHTSLGSSTTRFVLDSTDSSTFREPELVDEDMPPLEEPTPFGVYAADTAADNTYTDSAWAGGADGAVSDWQTPYSWGSSASEQWPSTTVTTGMTGASGWAASASVSINGRDMYEEEHWWDAAVRAQAMRPGPGVLPPRLADAVHNPEHTLFSVAVTPPEIKKSAHTPRTSTSSAVVPAATAPVATSPPTAGDQNASADPAAAATGSSTGEPAQTALSTSASPPPQQPPQPHPPPPPSAAEAREAVPHPNAYYCRKHNGWVLLHTKSSTVEPTLAASFRAAHPDAVLPELSRRRATESCVRTTDGGHAAANETHHMHAYPRAVAASALPTPFRRNAWERAARAKARHRAVTVREDVLSAFDDAGVVVAPHEDECLHKQNEAGVIAAADCVADGGAEAGEEAGEQEGEGELLDLYVCCQCQFVALVSDVIPGVVPVRLIEELVKEKTESPSLGKSGPATALIALETVINIIQNRLWKNEVRSLPVGRPAFQRKLGWNRTVQQIFAALDFVLERAPRPPGDGDAAPSASRTTRNAATAVAAAVGVNDVLQPPPITGASRARLLRAWVELSAWTADYMKRFPNETLEYREYSDNKFYVRVESAREAYQHDMGAHPDQIPRNDTLSSITSPEILEAIRLLGLTPTTYTWELLVFSYFAQARCDPANTPDYFEALRVLASSLPPGGAPVESLQNIVIDESERGRFARSYLPDAARALGFGAGGHVGLELDADVDDAFVESAWRDAVRRAWRGEDGASAHAAHEALRAVAETRGSHVLRARWGQARSSGMTPERAFGLFNVDDGAVDDSLLIAVYQLGVEDQPGQLDRLREALTVIAEYRDSSRLRKFLEIGSDPGDIVAVTRRDWPRGLNQLGNTCYLNSLLQYFYTIKDLRRAIAPLMGANLKTDEDDKLTDDELKRHRVGGRLVTRREIARSKQFVNQLAELFVHMQCADNPAVTPTLTLAKLALVTSKDEEEDADGGAAGSAGSNDTDATLVDEAAGPQLPPPSSSVVSTVAVAQHGGSVGPGSPDSVASGSSVLGKRVRTPEPMDVDSAGGEAEGSKAKRAAASPSSSSFAVAAQRREDAAVEVDVSEVQMADATPGAESSKAQQSQPPPLPARKAVADSGGMMFGRQHDVSECMDNCIFQIETALLRFDGMGDAEGDKTSLVKRLFFGKVKQRIVAQPDSPEPAGRNSIHEREDLFSLLPVNVSDESFDLYDGLAGYFVDTVEFEKRKARMEMSLVDLPPILQIQLQRAQFDRETLQPYKSQAYVKYGETLYMDRFLDAAEPEKRERSRAIQAELNECRDRIHQLTTGRHAPYGPALSSTAEFFRSQIGVDIPELDESVIDQLEAEQELLSRSLEHLRARAALLKGELEDLWRADRVAEYELTSVFIHRGASPAFGHYFFYSRHLPSRPDEWFKYNDAEVSLVPKDEVLADTTGQTANPYMLVYVRKGSDMIDTVDRLAAADEVGGGVIAK